jgi:hypothetical protein
VNYYITLVSGNMTLNSTSFNVTIPVVPPPAPIPINQTFVGIYPNASITLLAG